MNKNLLDTVVDLDERSRDGDVHNARTAIAVVPEGFLDGLREPEFTSHEASTRPRAGAVLWALDEAGQMRVEPMEPPRQAPAPPPAKPPIPTKPPLAAKPPVPAKPKDDDAPIVEVLGIESERPPFGSLPEIDLGEAIVELRASRTVAPKRPLPTWLVLLLVAFATTVVMGWVAVLMRFAR